MMAAALAALLLQAAPTVYEAKYRHDARLRKIPGVLDLSVGGVNGDLRLVVRVESAEAAGSVRAYCGGEKLEGYLVHVLVSAPKTAPVEPPPPPPPRRQVGQTVAEPCLAKTSPGATRAGQRPEDEAIEKLRDDTQCDLVREGLKLEPRRELRNPRLPRCSWTRRTVFGPGFANDPFAILRVIATPAGATAWKRGVGAGGTVWSCEYPRHRGDCPVFRRAVVDWAAGGTVPQKPQPLVEGPSGPEPVPPPPPRSTYRDPYSPYGPWGWRPSPYPYPYR